MNFVTYLYWTLTHPISHILKPTSLAVCWPFLQSCEWTHRFEPPAMEMILRGWIVLSLVAALLFARRSTCRWAWWALLAALVVKQFLVFGDYRLRLNQHYMWLWVTAAFLFLPDKRRVLSYLIVFFYVWAALLKLNPEWIGGNWTHGSMPLGIPEAWMPAASVYVLALELVIVWGLLARNAFVFGAAFFQFLLFHIASWNIVGFFYPLLMFGILALFPLMRMIPVATDGNPEAALGLRSLLTANESRSVVGTLVAFSLLQLLATSFPGDTAVTGEGRWFSLHMFDAPVHCSAVLRMHEQSGKVVDQRLDARQLRATERMHCDPLVYFSAAKAFCKWKEQHTEYVDGDFRLSSGRVGQTEKPVVAIDNFCATAPRYDWWRHNAWIAAGE